MFNKYIIGGLALAVLGPLHGANATPQYTLLYTFTGGTDGLGPFGGLIGDKAGNLYGATLSGGAGPRGTIFELAPNGTETVLHSFAGGPSDGSYPNGNLIRLVNGDLFGTTSEGGPNRDGIVFEIASDGTETVLYGFTGGADGARPPAGLTKVGKNFYGTTNAGGTGGGGTVFEIAKTNSGYVESTVYAFQGGSDGANPQGGMAADAAGNLYGTTASGGANASGTIFKIAPGGAETVLYSFSGSDGGSPDSTPILDSSGNLYGETFYGGANNYGVVYELTPGGTETVLYSFSGGSDGAYPQGGLTRNPAGNLYGVTDQGGAAGQGAVFKVAPNGTETVLYSFTGGSDGGNPDGSLLYKSGKLYGTAYHGGADSAGVLYSVTKK